MIPRKTLKVIESWPVSNQIADENPVILNRVVADIRAYADENF
jgi:hypothetical protein